MRQSFTLRIPAGGPRKACGPLRRIGLLAAGSVTAALLCGCGPLSCPEPAFDAGERVRVTVNGRDAEKPEACGVADLEPGTTFVLVGGGLTGGPECYVRAGAGGVPDPYADVLRECRGGAAATLGKECVGTGKDGCEGRARIQLGGVEIDRDDDVIDGVLLQVFWVGECWGCRDRYSVRLERLGKAP